jgi:hypothetical protein
VVLGRADELAATVMGLLSMSRDVIMACYMEIPLAGAFARRRLIFLVPAPGKAETPTAGTGVLMPRPASRQDDEQEIYGVSFRKLAASAAHADVMCDGMLRMCRPGAGDPRLWVVGRVICVHSGHVNVKGTACGRVSC